MVGETTQDNYNIQDNHGKLQVGFLFLKKYHFYSNVIIIATSYWNAQTEEKFKHAFDYVRNVLLKEYLHYSSHNLTIKSLNTQYKLRMQVVSSRMFYSNHISIILKSYYNN